MYYLIIIILFIIFLYSYIKEKNKASPLFIFSITWILIIFLDSIKLYNLYSTSNFAYLIILIGIVGFVFGYLINIYSFYLNKLFKNKIKFKNKYIFNIKIISYIILIIHIPYAIGGLFIAINFGSVGSIKEAYYSGKISIINSDIIQILYTYFAKPMLYVLIPYLVLNLNNKNFKKIKLLIIISIIFHYISTGSKIIIFLPVMYYFINLNNKKINKIPIIKLILILILAILSMYYSSGDVFKSAYTYICGCMPYLSIRLNNLGNYYTKTYGLNSFNGVIRPFYEIYSRIFKINDIYLYNIAENYIFEGEKTVMISDNIPYNGFASMFLNFYLDFGTLGVFFISLIFGFISKYYYVNRNCQYNNNYINYMVVVFFIITSMIRFQPSLVNFGMMIVLLKIIPLKIKY